MARKTKRLALILGSGFSAEAGLPTTSKLASSFLETPRNGALTEELEKHISGILAKFWQDIFGYRSQGALPSFEDHFTILDLAANAGHQLGKDYTPKKLRAIRRISIHRIFQILDATYRAGSAIGPFLEKLRGAFDVSIVTLNWDIVTERVLEGVRYGIRTEPLLGSDTFENSNGVLLLKVHGSSNWVYCDSCRRVYSGADKSALHLRTFLEKEDFELFGVPPSSVQDALGNDEGRMCPHCGNRMGGRVATFSYRKALSIDAFHTIWDLAHRELTDARIWLFVGYSMPEADFEFRYLLKSAQLGRKERREWTCKVILKDDYDAAERYARFFGTQCEDVYQCGLSRWVEGGGLDRFCSDLS